MLLANYNSDFSASVTENLLNNQSSPRSLTEEGNFTWGPFEVISEPFIGQDSNTGWSSYPSIAIENGKIYVVWHDDNNTNGAGTDYDIFYRYFDGTEWSEIQIISEPVLGKNVNTGLSWKPKIAVDNGEIYVVWVDENNTNSAGTDSDIFFRCNLTGSDWEPIQVISEPIMGKNINNAISKCPVIDVENGSIYVMWGDRNNTNNAGTDLDTFFRCNLTNTSWEPIQVISEPVPGKNFNTGDMPWSYERIGDISVEKGKIYTVWQDENNTINSGTDLDIFFRCNLTGNKWEDVQVISEPTYGSNNNPGHCEFPNIAVENNKIYIIWREQNWNFTGCGTDREIFFRCNLTSSTWEPIQVISEPVFGKNFNTRMSSTLSCEYLTVENGNIFVVWTDQNNTNGAGNDWDIHFRCNITGSGWKEIKVISEPIEGNNTFTRTGSSPAITVSHGKCHIVWADANDYNNSGTDRDVFYRWIQTPVFPLFLRFPRVTPFIGNSSTVFNYTIRCVHLKNEPKTTVSISIDGIKYSMLEVDPKDINYIDGKDYFFKVKNLGMGTHNFSCSANDGIYTFTIPILYSPTVNNTIPSITTENNLTASEDIYYNVSYDYQDIDKENIGQVGFWNFSTNATWLMFNFSTANLNGTPSNDNVGEYWINISINDTIDIDFTNFTLNVIDVNDPPEINTTNLEITYEDEMYEVDYEALDIDSPINSQIWTFASNASSWLDLNSVTGVLEGTPTNDEVGDYWVNVTVNDSEGGIDFTNFTLIVLNVNDPPVIITDDIITVTVGESYEVDYNATDIDSPIENQTWSIDSNATWLELNSTTGVLSGRPGPMDVRWYNVKVTVKDGDGGVNWHDFKLTVLRGAVDQNRPPKITTIDVISAKVNTLYEVDYQATDDRTPEDQLIWTLDSNASWLSIIADTGILNGIPWLDEVGWYWVNVSVDDRENCLDFHEFRLTVFSTPNKPPEIITDDILFAKVNVPYWVDYDASDDRTPIEYLQWHLDTNATWLDIDLKTGVLSGIPMISEIGTYWINVSVSDAEDGWDNNYFVLTVFTIPNATVPNKPPKIITEDKLFAKVDIPYSVDYEATDDRTPIEYLQWFLETDATWLQLDPTSGILNGTPNIEDLGEYNVKISVTDGEDRWDSQDFILTVFTTPDSGDINQPPEIITIDKVYAIIDLRYYVDYEANDDRTPRNYLQWFLETNATWLSMGPKTGELTGTPQNADIGTYWVKVSVTDNEDGWDEHEFTVIATHKENIENTLPVLSNHAIMPLNDDVYNELIFTIHYFDADSDAPLFVDLVINNKIYNMTLKSGQLYNGIYECMVNLSNGTHSYYFTASDGFKTVKTDDFNLDNIKKGEKTTDKKQSSKWSILITIITIIIILMILFLIVRRKRSKQKEKEIIAMAPTTPKVPTVASSQPIIATPTVIPSVIPTTSPEPQIDIEQPENQLLENKEKE